MKYRKQISIHDELGRVFGETVQTQLNFNTENYIYMTFYNYFVGWRKIVYTLQMKLEDSQ